MRGGQSHWIPSAKNGSKDRTHSEARLPIGQCHKQDGNFQQNENSNLTDRNLYYKKSLAQPFVPWDLLDFCLLAFGTNLVLLSPTHVSIMHPSMMHIFGQRWTDGGLGSETSLFLELGFVPVINPFSTLRFFPSSFIAFFPGPFQLFLE